MGSPSRRGTADREALKRCIAVLEDGEPLVLFPEGERKAGPIVQPLFDGAVYVALKAGVPIVPVGIGGSERVMPKKAKFVYPRKVHVIVGEPIQPAVPSESGRVPRSAIQNASDELHATLQELFDAAQTRVGQLDPSRRLSNRQCWPSRRASASGAEVAGSSAPHSSRAECIDSCGTPTSTVAMPSRVAVIGPIVEPHGTLLRDTNACTGTPAFSQHCRNIAAVCASVA